ncbi:MAG: potassium/proton antiporter [Coriobacteriales bacterium]|jgi:cell volume regulation protein A|nr:potassium/proton antiporter [Coriobacteriales bacterium]
MFTALILGSLIVIVCIAASSTLKRFGVPALIMFLILGLLAGWVGPWGPIYYDDYEFAENICSIALVFIIFYGGFGTNWKTARPVLGESIIYSTLGVLITAGIVTLFMHFVFAIGWAESFLIGSVVSCIDAASIFSILRSEKLSLRFNTASVLEIEGGCNDLPAYILTLAALIILIGENATTVFTSMLVQLIVGVCVGIVIAIGTVWILKKVGHHLHEGMNLLLVLAVSVLSYALAEFFSGAGYLATYLCGIILGNAKIPKRAHIVTLFDSIDWLAQIMIFFLLGLMAVPERLPSMIVPALTLTIFLVVVARPIATFAIFPLFKPDGIRNGWRKCLFISWAGIRGAASIVFVFLALSSEAHLQTDLFSLIFIVALLSITVQGTLFPQMAKWLNMVDTESDYHLSFNDFQEQSAHSFFRIAINEEHGWANRQIKEIPVGDSLLIVMIKRGSRTVTPRGDTKILPGDVVVLSGEQYTGDANTQITQFLVEANSEWSDKQIKDLTIPANTLIVSVVREDGSAVTPKGWVRIHTGDTLTLFNWD